MANQPEIDSYDAGIYQFEITDPAQGGVGGLANKPLLSLANRTNWLKIQIAAILTSLGNFAGLNSPEFSGSPTVPTASAGDQSLTISNTAFAQRMFSGIASVPIAGAGSLALTQPQWGNGIISLSGVLTGNRTIIFPNSGRWIVSNGTTGAFSVTCQTAAGSGVTVAQGKTLQIWGDGTNIQASRTDFTSITAAYTEFVTSAVAVEAERATTAELTKVPLSHMGLSGGANNSGSPNISASVSFTPISNGIVIVTGSAYQSSGEFTGINITAPGATVSNNYGNYGIGSTNSIAVFGAFVYVTSGTPVTLTCSMTGTGTSSAADSIGFNYLIIPTT